MYNLPDWQEIAQRRLGLFREIQKEFGSASGARLSYFHLQSQAMFLNDSKEEGGLSRFESEFNQVEHQPVIQDSNFPDLNLLENENLGIHLTLLGIPNWTPQFEACFISIGYALGAAQRWARHGNWRLTTIFLHLAELEQKVFSNFRARSWKSKSSYKAKAIIIDSTNVLWQILRCVALAGRSHDRFALAISEAYRLAYIAEEAEREAQRVGRHLEDAPARIIAWMAASDANKALGVIASLKEAGEIAYNEDSGTFRIRESPDIYTKKIWKESTLKRWWTEALKQRRNLIKA